MIRAVIFDLDGVLVATDELHFRAWKSVADREGIPFDRAFNERFRGVGRMECLDMLLERAGRRPDESQRADLAAEKDKIFRASLASLGPDDAFPGIRGLIEELRARGVKLAVGSASRNARLILERLDLLGALDVVVDGTMVEASKPDPAIFQEAARRLGIEASDCCVVEDSWAGAEAARRARMRVVGVGVGELGPVAARVANAQMLRAGLLLGEEPTAKGDS